MAKLDAMCVDFHNKTLGCSACDVESRYARYLHNVLCGIHQKQRSARINKKNTFRATFNNAPVLTAEYMLSSKAIYFLL